MYMYVCAHVSGHLRTYLERALCVMFSHVHVSGKKQIKKSTESTRRKIISVIQYECPKVIT